MSLMGLTKQIKIIRREIVASEGAAALRGNRAQHHPKLFVLYENRRMQRREQQLKREEENRQFVRRLEAARQQKVKRPPIRQPTPGITKTVAYDYDENDNQKIGEFYESRQWKMMRYETLRRHGAACQCCGRDRSDGFKMHVDHILALRVSWERRLDPDNLQVLCEDCNEGKGARHADDWR